jgi:hypothetical protein
MEAWRLKKDPWRVCRLVVADLHLFDEEQDPEIRIRIKVKIRRIRIRIRTRVKKGIRIRIPVFRIRKTVFRTRNAAQSSCFGTFRQLASLPTCYSNTRTKQLSSLLTRTIYCDLLKKLSNDWLLV